MTDVSFRPVFVTATLPIMYYNIYILLTLVSIQKKEEKKKLTYGPNNDRHVVWAHFHNCCPSRHVLEYIYPINIS